MLEIEIPKLRYYDLDQVEQLATDLRNLRSFSEVLEWGKRAKEEISKIRSAIEGLDNNNQKTRVEINETKKAHQAKPFLSKVFASREEEKRLNALSNSLTKEITQLQTLADQLRSAIDFAPTSSKDLKELLKECRVRKKGLQTEKKALDIKMKEIRAEARQLSAKTTTGKYGRDARRRIRLKKEAVLRPYEDKKAALDHQVLNLDRITAWLERFK